MAEPSRRDVESPVHIHPAGQSYLLKACLFATGLAGVVAEFVLSTLASYLLGNTTLQWTLVMSLMLFAMGLGSRISRHFVDRLMDRFIAAELLLSVLCATSAGAAYFAVALLDDTVLVIYAFAGTIGLLIGLEIPLVTRMNEAYEALRTNIASVLEKDYFGALAGGLLFAFFALPHLGLTYTPIALGAINFTVAAVLFFRFRGLLVHRARLTAAFVAVGVGLAALAVFIRPIVLFGEQSRYRDSVVYAKQTAYQRIVITEWKEYHWLYLNGSVQFSTYDEERYHEPLVHPAMKLSGARSRVLILGGGDGLAAREVLKYDDVESVTLVDLDPEMTEIAMTNPHLVRANEGALGDERLEIVHGDAGRFVKETGNLFDVIVADLPDPKGPDLSRLYSREFYSACRKILSQDGVIVMQSSSPLHAPDVFKCILKTMNTAGFTVLPYHNSIPTMGDWGWTLGMKDEVIDPDVLADRARKLSFGDVETSYLNSDAMKGMLHFWKGAFENLVDLEVNTELSPVVDRYYRNSEWGW